MAKVRECLRISQGANDVLSALAYLQGLNFLNTVLIGTSFGGACSLVATSKSQHVKKLLLRSPVADIYTRELLIRSKEDIHRWKADGARTFMNFNGSKSLRLKYSYIEDAKQINGLQAAGKIHITTHIVHGDVYL